jgi:Fur family transcriptional regulator, peroxide stress response regulator
MKNIRYSKQRENIKKGLVKFCVHPTAEELYLELKPKNLALSLATVYRNLNQLTNTGEIKKIEGLSEKVHYDHNNSEHYHMICLKCGRVEDLFFEPERLKEVLNQQNEFEIFSYDILVKGICKKCKKGDNNGI